MDAPVAELEGCYRSKNPASEMTVRVRAARRKQEGLCGKVDFWESGEEYCPTADTSARCNVHCVFAWVDCFGAAAGCPAVPELPFLISAGIR